MDSPTTPIEGQCQPEPEAPNECSVQPEEEPCPPADNADDYNPSVVEDPALECPPEEPSEEDQPPAECDVAPPVEDTQPETPPEEEPYASDLPVAGDDIPAEDVYAESTPAEALEPPECPPQDELFQADPLAETNTYTTEDIDPQYSSDIQSDPMECPPQEHEESLQADPPADDSPRYSSNVQLDPEGTTPESPAPPEVTGEVTDSVPGEYDPECIRCSEEADPDRPEPPDDNALSAEDASLEQPSDASQLEPSVAGAGDMDRKVPLPERFEPPDENEGLASEEPLQEERALELEYVDGKETVGGNFFLSTAPPSPPPSPLQNDSTAQIITQRVDQANLLPTAPLPPPPKPEGFLTLTYGWGNASEEPQPIQPTQDYLPPTQEKSHPTPERSDSRTHLLHKADNPTIPGMSDRPLPQEQIQTHTSTRRTQESRSSTSDATTSRLESSRGSKPTSRKQEDFPSTTRRAGESSSKGEQTYKVQQSQASVAHNTSNTQRKPQGTSPSRAQETRRPLSTLNLETPAISSSTRQEVHPTVASTTTEKTVIQNSEPRRTTSAPKLRDTQIVVARREAAVTNPTGFSTTNQKLDPRRSTPSPKVQDTRSTLPRNVSFDTTAQQPEPRRTTSTPRLQDVQPRVIPDVITASPNTTQQEPEPRRARSITRIQDPRPLTVQPHDNTNRPTILEQNPRPQTIYHPTDDRRSQSPEPRRTSTPASYDYQLHRSSTRGTEHRRGSQIYWADDPGAYVGPELSASLPPVPPKPDEKAPRPISHVDPRSIPLNGTLRNPTYSSSNGEVNNGLFTREDKVCFFFVSDTYNSLITSSGFAQKNRRRAHRTNIRNSQDRERKIYVQSEMDRDHLERRYWPAGATWFTYDWFVSCNIWTSGK